MRALRPLMLAGLAFAAGQAAGQTAGQPGSASGGQLTVPGAGTVVGAGPEMGATSTPAASPAAVLTLDQEALYRESRWGRRAQADLEARSRELAAENDRIAAQLEAEDDALTALRTSLPEAEFRRRADAFDAKVQQVRQDRDQAGRDLLATADADRTTFLNAALPGLTALMRERGAVALLDRRTVFLSIEQIDVTAAMIARVDAELGDGAGDGAANDGAANDGPVNGAGADDAGAGDAGAAGSTADAAKASVDSAGGNGAISGAAVDAVAAGAPAGAGMATTPEGAGSGDNSAAAVGGQTDGNLAGTAGAGLATLGAPASESGSSVPQPSGLAPAPPRPPAPPPSATPSR